MKTISDEAQEEVAAVLQLGELAVDATMGNGWDTLFLAERVGAGGRVFSFDVQEAALLKTQKKLLRADLLERCHLFRKGHQEMAQEVPVGVGAIMFNLGYLPHADRSVITRKETTLAALAAAATRLRSGGVLTIICYRGHVGGSDEAVAVWQWASQQVKEGTFVARKLPELRRGVDPVLISLSHRA